MEANVYLDGAFPRPPPDGAPVVLGQLPPGPEWLDGPRPPLEPPFELPDDLAMSILL
tara:strand:- start:334 stop:504 length:171 start_codon:yes stop_codon:yes gene_type:complete